MSDLIAIIIYTSNLQSLYSSDIEKIQAGIGDKLALFLQALSTFIAGFVIGYIINWKLALVVSVMLPLLIGIAALVAKVS